MIPRILVFAGSIRSGAFSGLTADAATRELALLGAEVTRISLADYPLPIMDQDLERRSGVPENAMRLGRLIDGQDGLLISSPEYNASIPPLLKNTLDWLSRIHRDGGRSFEPLAGKAVGLCSSSDGAFGGARGLYHLRAVLMACGFEIITPQCTVARASQAFDEEGGLREERPRAAMADVCRALVERARLLSRRVEA